MSSKSDASKDKAKTAQDEKQARLEKALRDNLKRRKQQARLRAQSDDQAADIQAGSDQAVQTENASHD